MEFGRFLYEMYKTELWKVSLDGVPDWDKLNQPERLAWDGLAKRIKGGEEI